MKRTVGTTSERETKRQRVNGFHQNTSMTTTTPTVIIPIIEYDDDITDDDDIVILETSSTPIRKKVKSESKAVKTLTGTGPVKTNAIVTNSMKTGTTAINTSPPIPPSEQVSITTQTETRNKVKDEEEEEHLTSITTQTETRNEVKDEEEEEHIMSITTETETWNEVKDEEEEELKKAIERGRKGTKPDNPSAGTSSAGPSTPGPLTPGLSTAGPSTAGLSDRPNIEFHKVSDPQEQQDNLIELLQATAYERDQSEEQVHKLTCQVHELKVRVQELSQAAVKQELCHKACQTGERVGGEQLEDCKVPAKERDGSTSGPSVRFLS